MDTIGILLISTWKYNKFIDNTINSIKKYFFPKNKKIIYLHTDSTLSHDAIIIPIEHKPWPNITLNKFNTFIENTKQYQTDYLFYLDIDVTIHDYIQNDILHDLIAVYHSYHYRTIGTVEKNPKSTAFIKHNSDHDYIAGGFIGGKTNVFLDMCKNISDAIDIDKQNNITAIWHDESHLNKYVFNHKDKFKILEPEYMTVGSRNPHKKYLDYHKNQNIYKAKIMAMNNPQKKFNKFE